MTRSPKLSITLNEKLQNVIISIIIYSDKSVAFIYYVYKFRYRRRTGTILKKNNHLQPTELDDFFHGGLNSYLSCIF